LGRIAEEIIQRIGDRVDMVDLVGRHVALKKAGRSFVGLCPFHDEKTPSFHVSPERRTYHCFGCQAGGDAFKFLMEIQNLTFPEAVRMLGGELGVEVPETGGGEVGRSERLYPALETAQAFFRESLSEPGNPGAAYLSRRGLDAEAIERFAIGYAPDSWDALSQRLRDAGIAESIAFEAGVLAERRSGGYYDFLRGRIVFPIQDARGRVVAFGGRVVAAEAGSEAPKYLNSRESPVFRKRESLYGFPRALEPIRRNELAVVVEGYFDQVALDRAGIAGTVATCGTALSSEHARELRRRTRTVVLMFDGDEAGQKAVERSLEVLLPAGLRVKAALLPPGVDPDDLLVRDGPGALRELVDTAPPALERVIQRAVSAGCASPSQKADAVEAVAPLLAKVESPVERGEYTSQLAMAVGTDLPFVEPAVRAAARGENVRDALPAQAPRRQSHDHKLYQLTRCLVEYPELAARLDREELSETPEGPLRRVIEALIDAAAGASAGVRADAVAEGLDDEARATIRGILVAQDELTESVAVRILEDTLAWMRNSRSERQQRELTRQLRDSDGQDLLEILQKKQEMISQKKRELHRSSVEAVDPMSADRIPR
jgi:DNA primase